MANLAAIIPSPQAPLVVQEVEKYKPGPNEFLVRNELIAFNPVEYKIAKLGVAPLSYPAILGSSFTGTIEAVGDRVRGWKIGEKVVVSRKFGVEGNQYGAYQRFVVVGDRMVSRVPEGGDGGVLASLMMNLTCVAGLFTGVLGLERPELGKAAPMKGVRVLVYGGSSSFGGLSVQYLSQAGYTVITTSSPRNRESVEKLGAARIVDHTMEAESLTSELTAAGPYQAVVDMISTPNTMSVTGRVVEAQGGGKLYVMQPAMGAEALPKGVEWVFEPWSDCLYDEKNRDLQKWVVEQYVPHGITRGIITPVRLEKVAGGLAGVNDALDRLEKGVSGLKLVADPWE